MGAGNGTERVEEAGGPDEVPQRRPYAKYALLCVLSVIAVAVVVGYLNRRLQTLAVSCMAGWLARPPPMVTRDPYQEIWCTSPAVTRPPNGLEEGERYEGATAARMRAVDLLLDADEFRVESFWNLYGTTEVPVSVRHSSTWSVVLARVERKGLAYRVVHVSARVPRPESRPARPGR
ncbi:MAG: hypothetical protein HYZ29_36730 [Myxococcales bacterium]|nr:hypothetical protein [Myxococcales bacterium]